MKHPTHDQPWRRPGALAYARTRRRNLLHPPVTVEEMPADVTKDEDVPVTMRDGVTLRLNLFRPAGEGPFPVILSAHPYGKDSVPVKKAGGWKLNKQYRIMNQPEPLQISDQTSWEAPDPVWWTQQGYAVINLDTRGGGRSDGRGDLLSDQEADDISQVIAWAADQPWSTGRIGMLGVSYLALSQYKVAALNPPALKAICPWEGFTDAYRDFFTPGGVVEDGFARVWLFLTNRVARLTTNMAKERAKHPLRDAWWEALTPDLGRITVPMLVCASFSDDNLHSGGSMRAFQQVGSSERHAYTHRGPKWATFYGGEARRTQLAFFDRHLRQRDVAPLPPVRLEVRDRVDHVVEVRDEQEWPLARTDWRQLYLAADGALTTEPHDQGSVTFDLQSNAAAFEYRFEQDTELSGPMTLRLQVAVTGTDDPRLFVGVEKWCHGAPVPFNGSYGYGRDRVAQGRLRLALRELDPQRSTPHQPEHSFRTLQPVHDNEQMEVLIPLSSSATLFRAGDCLRVMIAGRYLQPRNPLFGHFPTHYQPSTNGKATLRWSPDRPSSLEIPVIPRTPSAHLRADRPHERPLLPCPQSPSRDPSPRPTVLRRPHRQPPSPRRAPAARAQRHLRLRRTTLAHRRRPAALPARLPPGAGGADVGGVGEEDPEQGSAEQGSSSGCVSDAQSGSRHVSVSRELTRSLIARSVDSSSSDSASSRMRRTVSTCPGAAVRTAAIPVSLSWTMVPRASVSQPWRLTRPRCSMRRTWWDRRLRSQPVARPRSRIRSRRCGASDSGTSRAKSAADSPDAASWRSMARSRSRRMPRNARHVCCSTSFNQTTSVTPRS